MKLRANKGVGDAVERDNCDVHRCALETDELENVENVENVESGVLNTGQSQTHTTHVTRPQLLCDTT